MILMCPRQTGGPGQDQPPLLRKPRPRTFVVPHFIQATNLEFYEGGFIIQVGEALWEAWIFVEDTSEDEDEEPFGPGNGFYRRVIQAQWYFVHNYFK